MVRSILGFLGFGRSARLARMVRKAGARTLRMYGPTFGFYGAEYRNTPRDTDDAGYVRSYVSGTWAGQIPTLDLMRVPPYRAGWGIVPTFVPVPRPYPYADAFV